MVAAAHWFAQCVQQVALASMEMEGEGLACKDSKLLLAITHPSTIAALRLNWADVWNRGLQQCMVCARLQSLQLAVVIQFMVAGAGRHVC
jgi:hypothetical protein